MAEKNRVVASFDFLLGLVELGMAYAIYEIYSALNASYLSSASSATGLTAQAANGLLLVSGLVAVFVGIHGIKRLLENLTVFVRAAAAATRSVAAASQETPS